VSRQDEINVTGDYVESGVYHLLPIYHVYIEVRIMVSASLRFETYSILVYKSTYIYIYIYILVYKSTYIFNA
jgi:hypothetical protein